MRHALTRALAGYDGSLVLVSHDRALLRTVCDSFMLVADGRAIAFDGDLEDYLAWLTARRDAAPQDETAAGAAESRETAKHSAKPRPWSGSRSSRGVARC